MMKILDNLEQIFPTDCKSKDLVKKLNLKLDDKEFSKAIAYLLSKEHIQGITIEEGTILSLKAEDKTCINPSGIDFLTELKKIESNDKRNKSIEGATIILALVAMMQGVLYFKQFSNQIENLSDVFALIIITILLVVIVFIGLSFFYNKIKTKFF